MDGRGEHGGAIAIVGIACQFPGARDPAEFHELTVTGGTMFREVIPGSSGPPGSPWSGPSGRTLHAALLDGWGATSHEVGSIHKLAAETIALALADAGFPASGAEPQTGGTARTRVGLLVASSVPDVCDVACEGFGIEPARRFPPSAYPSSPHAIVAACDALRAGELDVAIAGGVELGIDPRWLAQQAAAGALGTTQMRVYDSEPAGVLPGDGCGIAILVRAADARAQAKPVYAEVAGWEVVPARGLASATPDGIGLGLLSAYGQARVDPADVHLIEGHGAGTAASETAELEALTQLRHGSKSRAALGAVSASIGHTRAASGIASLIKTVTAMVAGTIPPGTGCPHPHPLLASGDARLRLPASAEPWPGTTRLAAVNSFIPPLPVSPTPTPPIASPPPVSPALGQGTTIHLVLRRVPDETPSQGRRRRPATEAGNRDQTPTVFHPQSPSPGRHTAPPHPQSPSPGRHSAPSFPATSAAGKITPRSAVVAVPAQRIGVQEPPAIPTEETAVRPVANVTRTRRPAEQTAAPKADDDTRPPQPGTGTAADRGAPDDAPVVEWPRSWTEECGSPHPTTHNGLTIPAQGAVSDGGRTHQFDAGRHEGPATNGVRQEPGPARVRQRAGQELVFAFCGMDAANVAATLDVVAGSAADLGDADLRDLARQLAGTADRNTSWGDGELLRVAVTAAAPDELAAVARRAARMVRATQTGDATRTSSAAQVGGAARGMTSGPGMAMSVGMTGALTVVFPGFADSAAEHTSLLAGSLDALRVLERLGTRASTAVGYSFGEVTGLVWAGCLSPAEAARIAALRGRVLRGCVARPAAMARVHVDVDLARKLIAADGQPASGLHIAAYETATSHLLAGPASAIRDLARRGAEIGVPVDVLPVVGAMHSPAIADCAAPLRSVLAAMAFQPPRRGLISTVTGQPVTTDHDAAYLLAEQITRPVLFAQAMALAANRANLVVVAGPGGDPASGPGNSAEPSLAALATAASGIPAIQLPRAADVPTIAALFTAGALKELGPLIANSLSKDTSDPIDMQSSWTVPPARNGMADNGAAGNGVHSHNGAGREATAQSADRTLAERVSQCAGAP